MEISFISMQSLVNLKYVNKTNFHMKGFALGLALKQRQKATQKSPILNAPLHCTSGTFQLIAGRLENFWALTKGESQNGGRGCMPIAMSHVPWDLHPPM